jgi:nicotinate-nucleotide adenylyltransferase
LNTVLKHTGLLFGSFNPIHIGHLALANYIIEYSGLDEIWFVVSPQNPFKESDELIDEQLRLKMVELAIQNEPRFKASDVEFEMARPSFTTNTLSHLQKEFPQHQFSIIMGSDNLQSIDRWKNASEIVATYPIIVYPRPGFAISQLPEFSKISIIEAPQLDISSTLIRKGIGEGKKLQFLVPNGVFEFIESEGLYGAK